MGAPSFRIVMLGLFGCALQPAEVDDAGARPDVPLNESAFTRTEFTRAHLSFDGLVNASSETGNWKVGGHFAQVGALADDAVLRVSVQAGPELKLESKLSSETSHWAGHRSATVCGSPP